MYIGWVPVLIIDVGLINRYTKAVIVYLSCNLSMSAIMVIGSGTGLLGGGECENRREGDCCCESFCFRCFLSGNCLYFCLIIWFRWRAPAELSSRASAMVSVMQPVWIDGESHVPHDGHQVVTDAAWQELSQVVSMDATQPVHIYDYRWNWTSDITEKISI